MPQRYRHLVIDDDLYYVGSPSPEEILAIEEKLSAKLPIEFVEFLNAANGAELEYVIDIEYEGGVEPFGFRVFRTKPGQSKSQHGYFLYEIDRAREIFKIPTQILPFADGGGAAFFLDLTQGKNNVIAFVEGMPEWAGDNRASGYSKVADSFDEFIERLRFDEDRWKRHVERLISENQPEYLKHTKAFLDLALPNWREKFGIDI